MERREFMAGALALAKLRPGVKARSAARTVGANDRINIGMIGVGGMGGEHLRLFMAQSDRDKDIQVVAVSDVYTVRKEKARQTARLEAKDVHHDYRDLLARSDVDAVLIATPDHWHAQMALDALAAGKDVYLQKPMTHTIPEARAVADAVKEFGRVLQVGSQGLSSFATKKARELVDAGAIGPLLWAQGGISRNSGDGEWNWDIEPEGTPETIDWKRWLGTAPKRPFSAERYFRWRKYWDYSGGIATDLYYHSLGPLLYAMGPQLPKRVTAAGGIYVQKDRDVPDTYQTTIEYANFFVTLSGSMANARGGRNHAPAIYGHNGTIVFDDDDGVELIEEVITPGSFDRRRPPKMEKFPAPKDWDTHRAHTDNFFACMRSRKQPQLDAELGYMIMAAIRGGVEAYRARES